MKLPDDNKDKSGMTPTIVSTIVAVSMFVLVILLVVLYINHKQNPPRRHTNVQPGPVAGTVAESYPDTADLIGDSTLTPDDLDFWDVRSEERRVGKECRL